MAEQITDKNFKSKVLESAKPVLVDFWAEWCGPCRMLAPIIEELGVSLKDKVAIYKMDIEENPATPSEFGIRSIPTMILFNKGEQVGVKTGLSSKENIENWISDILNKK
jgi:thioredoxin 1